VANNTNKSRVDQVVYSFGDFSLDSRHGVLRRGQEFVSLRPKSWDVLLQLVRRHGELVTRADLIESVWSNTAVTEDSITQCIVELRRLLGDADHTLIRTVPRRGFIFEMPVEQFVEDAGVPSGTGSPRYLRWPWGAAASLPFVIFLVFWIAVRIENAEHPAITADRVSVAVLPFTDMTAAADKRYFGDGVAEEILHHLTKIPELRVIARSSSFRFRDKPDIAVIADDLNADFVLEGALRGRDDQLRITAQLINTATNAHVWSDSYDRQISVDNLISMQNEIAAGVVAAIGVETGTLVSPPPEQNASVAPAAMNLYLQGLYHLRKLQTETQREEEFDAAIGYMEAAIAADPDWAPPHAAIGTTLHFLATTRLVEADRVGDVFAEARRNLLDAISLDPNYGPAYGSLAFIAHYYEHDYQGAESLYAKADALGDRRYWGQAIMLKSQGRLDEAIDRYQQAALQDPLSDYIAVALANALICAGRYEEGVQKVDSLLQKYPEDPGLWSFRAFVSARTGDTTRAKQIIDAHRDGEDAILFAGAMALVGMRDEAEAMLDELDQSPPWNTTTYLTVAEALGQPDRALDYLERAALHEPRLLIGLQCPGRIGSLATNDRLRTLLTDAGIPVNLEID
jgi:TolB-like protein/DNA-binding winged helix-turn-helix (wHTH) protein/Flp pilus assembly protein TadD